MKKQNEKNILININWKIPAPFENLLYWFDDIYWFDWTKLDSTLLENENMDSEYIKIFISTCHITENLKNKIAYIGNN